MEIVLLIARLFLASVFVVAGITKTADPVGGRKALIGFGVSDKLATPLGWFLPFVEIGVAVSLIPVSTAWLGAIAGLALMLVFVVAIGVSLLRGRAPECNCFGQLHSKPVSWSMFTRNLLLAAVAALIVVQGKEGPGLSALNWLADLKAAEIVGLVISSLGVALVSTAVVYLRRVLYQQTMILARIDAMKRVIDEDYAEPPVEREDATPPGEGLPVGAPAPDFSIASINGGHVSLEGLLEYGKSVLLLFVSPNCAPCEAVLLSVKDWQRDYGDRLTFALLSKGSLKENQDRVAKYGAVHLLLVGESKVAEDYRSTWTPAAVLISSVGRIASQNAYGDEDIRTLVNHVIAGFDVRPGDDTGASGNGHRLQIPVGKSIFKVGDPAPPFSIPDTAGNVVNTADLRGSDTLLLFWDPGCPFCQAMSEDVKRWEENPPPGAPRLVFVASGDLEKVKDASEGFESRFLHDYGFQVGMLLGTRSTPSAVLIDSEGRIASSIATGSSNVLLLAGVRKAAARIESSS